ncbi:hypothetical protein AGMMS49957_16730 [Synergistales bacterium]|nr:hypothetical protein AGMMS49957_16730 [Synergistales bacterium]
MQSSFQKRREDFAERVADALKNGIVPWQKKELPDSPMQSAISNRRYENINALRLMEKRVDNGYKDPRFITASEAKKNGVYVKKDEQGVVLEHWFEGKDGKIHAKGYSVFNVEQLNGKLPDSTLEKLNPQKGQELVSEANTIPRGLDSNLPNADLSGVQESVIASASKASEQVNSIMDPENRTRIPGRIKIGSEQSEKLFC